MENIDIKTVEGFGDEWKRFDQSGMSEAETLRIFNNYFEKFPWQKINDKSVGFDMGCGSGRWAKLVAPKVGKLHCIDPSQAIDVAKVNLSDFNNCIFHKIGVQNLPFENNSMDFGYSLGVLHHIPDTFHAMQSCVNKIKSGAPFLVYIYYAFDNKPIWYKWIWKISDIFRYIISTLPHNFRYIVSQIIAVFIYFPLARLSKILELMKVDAKNISLSAYRNTSFYVMRTDALDRFGTRLEQRFTKAQIEDMMKRAELISIEFVENKAFWTAIGIKA